MLATQVLKDEHHSIGRMLTIVQRAANRLNDGQEVPPQMFRDATDFFLDFANGRHYGKEESWFVPALEQVGIHRDCCAIDLVLREHEQARQLSHTMAVAADRLLQGDQRVSRTLVLTVRDYVQLIRSHVIKEDIVVFRLADTVLPEAAQNRLLRDFEAIDSSLSSPGTTRRFDTMLDEMESILAIWPSPFAYSSTPVFTC